MKEYANNQAFTLVEAVLAIAIISVSAIAMLTATSTCLGAARRARNYHTAVAVLDQGELEHPLLPTNAVEDNIVEPYEPLLEGFVFSRDVEEIEEEEDLFVIRTRVTWSRRGKNNFEEVVGCLYSTNHP